VRVVGCHYDAEGAGLYQFDAGHVVPPARDPAYVDHVIALCREEGVQIIMPGSMLEMRVLAEHAERIGAASGAVVVSSPTEVLRRMEDKWELTRYLASGGFEFPRSVLPNDAGALVRFLDEVPYPYIVKDRFGAGSQGVGTARTPSQLARLIAAIPTPLVQEYLGRDDEEYTVGVFVCADGRPAGSIAMRRTLGLGMTWKGEVLTDPALGHYCERVLAGSGCLGPCNVQLRLTRRGPVVFAVNPRFSSTTSARAHYGYNEAEMSVRHLVLGETPARPVVRAGRFYRVIEEVHVAAETYDLLCHDGYIGRTAPTLV
jgi:carbamoyl-phosphate synthase large subunit